QDRYLQKNLPHLKELGLFFAPVGQLQRLVDDLVTAAFIDVFVPAELPRSRAAFEACIEAGRGQLVEVANRYAETLYQALRSYHEVAKRLKGKINIAMALSLTDVKR